jgi:hypothetical protein
MADISGLVEAPFDIDEQGKVAADADRVEMIEEEEPIAAEQILNIVLRRHDERIDAGRIEQRIETFAVKRRRRRVARPRRRRLLAILHGFLRKRPHGFMRACWPGG